MARMKGQVVPSLGIEWDWRDRIGVLHYFVTKQDSRGRWRAYWRDKVAGYSDSNFHSGATYHERDHALRLMETGKPLPPTATADEQLDAIRAVVADPDALMPWG